MSKVKAPLATGGLPLQAVMLSQETVGGTPLTVSGTSNASSQIGSVAFYFCSTVHCHISIDLNPVASTANAFIPAYTPVIFSCYSENQIAVIKAAGVSDGTAWIVPVETEA